MPLSKAQIRGEFHTRRRRRRTVASPECSLSEARIREREGLFRQWGEVCARVLGETSPQLPALFVPTANEPDVSLIVESYEICFLPSLTYAGGQLVNEPLWARHRRGDRLRLDHPRFPAGSERPSEPASVLREADIVLVPALAVDSSGMRLGQGGGWYDRALGHVCPGALIVAAVFDDECVEVLPCEPHDHRVDAVITPTRTIFF